MAGKTTLINSRLINSTIYRMSMFLLPKIIIKRMDKNRRKFFLAKGEFEEEIPFGKVEQNL
jgi:hypothetical protein